MQHRIEIATDPTSGFDNRWFGDMFEVNFPMFNCLTEDMRIITPSSILFVAEFRFDGNLLTWIHFLIANGVNFTYRFIG